MSARSERMERSNRRGGAIAGCLSALALLLAGSFASAATIETLLTPFTGGDAEARIVLDDAAAMPGEIEVTVEMTKGVADIRGVFFELALDDALLSGLSAYGSAYVTSYAYGDLFNLGRGSNLHGGGSPCPCDFGVEIGTPGMGKDDIQSLSFILAHESLALDLGMFFEQSVGLRLTSLGLDDAGREDSAKLRGVLPIPEPASGLLVGVGLCAMAVRARGRA